MLKPSYARAFAAIRLGPPCSWVFALPEQRLPLEPRREPQLELLPAEIVGQDGQRPPEPRSAQHGEQRMGTGVDKPPLEEAALLAALVAGSTAQEWPPEDTDGSEAA